MARTNNADGFLAKLLASTDGVLAATAIADDLLREEAEQIEEAIEKVAQLTAARDAAGWGTRARAVQNIMLEWWEGELADLIGFQAGRA